MMDRLGMSQDMSHRTMGLEVVLGECLETWMGQGSNINGIHSGQRGQPNHICWCRWLIVYKEMGCELEWSL